MSKISTMEELKYILWCSAVGADGTYLYKACNVDSKYVRHDALRRFFKDSPEIVPGLDLDTIRSQIIDKYKDDLELAILEMEMLNS